MSATGYTPIQLYYSTTAAAVPVNTNLANGELAINITDGKLYYKDNGGTVRLLASNGTSAPVTTFSAGTTGFTPSSATSGAVTLAGTLGTANGGTNLTTFTNTGVFFASSTSVMAQSANFTWSGTSLAVTGTVAVTGALTATLDSTFSSTGALLISKGTTAQQPGSPVTGMLRYNTTTNQFEGYSGSSAAWNPVGGASLSNDTSTASNLYPLFANATSGSATTLYTGNAKLLYKPSTGELQASVPVALNGIVVNSQTVATSYTIAAGYSAMSSGPITVASGQAVTVSSGSRWVVV
jgi:hypothetical protein